MAEQKHTPTPSIPQGMIAVSKDEFFKALEADKRDIMPSVKDPYITHGKPEIDKYGDGNLLVGKLNMEKKTFSLFILQPSPKQKVKHEKKPNPHATKIKRILSGKHTKNRKETRRKQKPPQCRTVGL